MSNDHRRFRMLAAAAVDGQLSAEEAEELEAHLATCASCRNDQLGMLRDHEWLATPGPVAPPNERVRAAVLRAVRSQPRTMSPWLSLLAASLAVLAIGVGALEVLSQPQPGVQGTLPSGTPNRPSPTIRLGDPFATGSAHFVPTGETAPGALELALTVSGGIFGRPSGSLEVTAAEGESWLGTISAAGYWYDENALMYGTFIQGCKTGPSCERFAIEIVVGSGIGDPTTLRIAWPTPEHPDASDWQASYELDSGAIEIGGSLVSRLKVAPLLATSQIQAPSGTVPYALGSGTLAASESGPLQITATVVGGRGSPVRGVMEFADSTQRSWSLAVIAADYWHDESGSSNGTGPYVAFIHGCVLRSDCAPLAVMIVDNREARVADRVGLAWGWTRPTAESGGEYQWYELSAGNLDVGGCMATVINGAMTDATDDQLCAAP